MENEDRRIVESNATDKGWSRIVAKVKTMVPIDPTVHVKAEIHKTVRSFCADVESFPCVSNNRKPIANKFPTTAKLPIRDRYLKTVLKAIIGP